MPVNVTGRTYQSDEIPQARVNYLIRLSLEIDRLVNLPQGNVLSSRAVLKDTSWAASVREFGEFWIVHWATGHSLVLNPSFFPALAPRIDVDLRLEDCIAGLETVLDRLRSLDPMALDHHRDAMTLARAALRYELKQ